ncbi:MAG TPA: hypothetical protein O0X45_05860 [Methanocorpusculum sp.]|nr:hypothetical protein [Methanocorpusculum sp.]HJK82338.1 hypothetical protein [Methanocorpusculum sp.]
MSNGLSLSTRRNLWKSKTAEERYARDLRRLFNTYGSAATQLLLDSVVTNPDGSATVDLTAFKRSLGELSRQTILQPGEVLTEESTRRAFDLGQGHADADYEKQVKIDRTTYLH